LQLLHARSNDLSKKLAILVYNVLFCLSCSDCPIVTVLFFLPCSSYPIPPILFCLSCSAFPVIVCLSCHRVTVSFCLSRFIYLVLSIPLCLSCSVCPSCHGCRCCRVLAVLLWPVLAFLSWHTYSGSFVLLVIFCLPHSVCVGILTKSFLRNKRGCFACFAVTRKNGPFWAKRVSRNSEKTLTFCESVRKKHVS
jgi:hypothetical protein